MDESDEEITNSNGQPNELSLKSRELILKNELRTFRNHGFHDGYDDGKQAVSQKSFDAGYKKAFEQNFILSTLKGVAHALRSSYNIERPTSTTSSSTSSSSTFSASLRQDTQFTESSSSERCSSSNSINHVNLNISSSHLSILESMKFDNAAEIESIKNDLIKICRENRLEILAHYVSHMC